MIPIIDFCWQAFQPVEFWDDSIQELTSLTSGSNRFAVIYSRHYCFSAFIIPELVTQLVHELALSPRDSALATGLLDLLRQSQIAVYEQEPADRVAQLAVRHEIEVVLALNKDAIPIGLFIPSIVTERLPHTSMLQQSSPQLQETVRQLTTVDGLPGAIVALASEHQRFHSEFLTQKAAYPFICEDRGVFHYVFDPQCSRHPGAVVR